MASLPCLSSFKMTVKPMEILSNSPKTAIPYELKKGQNRLFYKLPSGLKMEVIEQRKDGRRRRRSEEESPPLVFVHGSYHAAWCWAEHWLPFFSSSGFDSYAISLLGQGESDEPLGTVAGMLGSVFTRSTLTSKDKPIEEMTFQILDKEGVTTPKFSCEAKHVAAKEIWARQERTEARQSRPWLR